MKVGIIGTGPWGVRSAALAGRGVTPYGSARGRDKTDRPAPFRVALLGGRCIASHGGAAGLIVR
jgi:hypothetical protein